jgi:hypothetical protein
LAFRVYKVQDDGKLHFIRVAKTLDDGKACVRELGDVWHGEYVIHNEETGERVFVSMRDETRN